MSLHNLAFNPDDAVTSYRLEYLDYIRRMYEVTTETLLLWSGHTTLQQYRDV